MDFHGVTDTELWLAFRQGNEQAYAALYQKFTPSLYSYGYGIRKDRQLVADCIQDLFVHLYQQRSTLGQVQSIKYYLFKILRHRLLDAMTRQAKYAFAPYNDDDYHFEVVQSPESIMIEGQHWQKRNEYVQKLVDGLPKRQREALYLMYYERLSHQEVATLMSLEVKTVYNLLYEALQSLRKKVVKLDLLLSIALTLLLLLSQ